MEFKIITYTLVTTLIIGLTAIVYTQNVKINNLENDLSVSVINNKALLNNNNLLKDKTRTLLLTVEHLNSVTDSVITKMNNVRKELKIKDKEIKELQYQLSTVSKTDTVYFRDTIFKKGVLIDTVLSDKWYKLKLSLEHPSKITVSPTFKSERYVNLYLKKETINPPKKCWIARLFQKKHNIIEAIIEEKNPYIKVEEQKYIKIVE